MQITSAFRKCFTSLKNFKIYYFGIPNVSTKSNFRDEYAKHLEELDIVASCAKIYILSNYKKVKDWSKLDLTIKSGTNQKTATGETFFYNHTPYQPVQKGKTRSSVIDDMWIEHDKVMQKKHNPIESVTKVILDYTDGDFSLTINGLEFWWIYNDAIIVIANYIEEQLNKKEEL